MKTARLHVDTDQTIQVPFDPMDLDNNEYFVYCTVYQDRKTLEVIGAHYDLNRQPSGIFGEEFIGAPVDTANFRELEADYYGFYSVPVTVRTCWAVIDREEWL